MMSEYICLKRRMQTAEHPQRDSFVPFEAQLEEYRSSVVLTSSKEHYSKIAAIHRFYEGSESGIYSLMEGQEIARAFLTDRGLLFPQTRERQYQAAGPSMKEYGNYGENYTHLYRETLKGCRDTREYILRDAEKHFKCRMKNMDESRPETLQWENVEKALRLILDQCDACNCTLASAFRRDELYLDDQMSSDKRQKWVQTVALGN